VYSRDWKRAQTALASATDIAPDDKSIRGKARLVDGYLRLRAADLKGARSDFEEAHGLLPHSPDPHLGLANIYMADGDLDKAEDELSEAQRSGFRPGRREQKALADGYRKRGERWIKEGQHAHEIGQMQDALKHAEDDLDKAQKLYSSVAPFLDGLRLADLVSGERDTVAKTLASAQQASEPRETP
jgi:tetratricopeptide (TPR) repeat protein